MPRAHPAQVLLLACLSALPGGCAPSSDCGDCVSAPQEISAPAGLALAASPTNTAPALHWNGVTGVSYYAGLRSGVKVGQAPTPSSPDSAPPASGTSSYSVRAGGRDGPASPSPAVSVVFDTLPPNDLTAAPSA